ncbi:MAG: hypothetical protein IKN55_11265 [Oscillospiraceae bacterium]|nr:hypothetical protein [Oscillospiraceae bacterium]
MNMKNLTQLEQLDLMEQSLEDRLCRTCHEVGDYITNGEIDELRDLIAKLDEVCGMITELKKSTK